MPERKRLQHARGTKEAVGTSPKLPHGLKKSLLENHGKADIYKAQLATQTEELQRSHSALLESRRRYAELYDLAPVAYLLFSPEGIIREVNFTGAQLLGIEPRDLIHKAFHRFMTRESRQSFYQFCTRLFTQGEQQTCDLRLIPKDGRPLDVHMVGIVHGRGLSTLCQAAFIDVTERKKAEEQLKSSREELQASTVRLKALTAQLQAIHEEEKSILAREIHDELSQALTALKMDVSLLPDRAAKNRKLFLEKLDSMSELIDHTLDRVREIVTELRPVVLDKFGLVAAIEWQTSEFQKRSRINCEAHLPTKEIPLSPALSTAAFRILQEALTNVARHARATKVVIDLTNEAEQLVLSVRDNGIGIDEKAIDAHKSVGLLGMRERALSFGGTTEVIRLPGRGTLVQVRIPVTRASPGQ
jgi:PAS domain S-box-containing protein